MRPSKYGEWAARLEAIAPANPTKEQRDWFNSLFDAEAVKRTMEARRDDFADYFSDEENE